MKKSKRFLYGVLAATLLFSLLTGCSKKAAQPEAQPTSFSYSKGIDENGFFEGITARDYVENLKYKGISIPGKTYVVTDKMLQAEIAKRMDSYADPSKSKQIKNRKIVDGDTVNIDYAGSVDGVAFDGGTQKGAEVTIGVTNFIDNFLEQLIGHKPGDKFDVKVTFPDSYPNSPDLQGKKAVFATTINYIVKKSIPKLTDKFVKDKFSKQTGWNTVADMKKGTREDLRTSALQQYISNYMVNDVKVTSIPDQLLKYQEDSMVNYAQESAKQNNMEINQFLQSQAGVSSINELIEKNKKQNSDNAKYTLVIQAVAEDAKISVSVDDIKKFFVKMTGSADYSAKEKELGLPYIKQSVLCQKVIDYMIANAVSK